MGCCNNDNSISLTGIQGPAGPIGPQGPQGDPGPAGATGAAGVSSVRKFVAEFDGMKGDTAYQILAQQLIDCGLLMPCCPDLDTPDPVYVSSNTADFVWRMYFYDSGSGYWQSADSVIPTLNINRTTGTISFTTPTGITVGTYRLVIIG